MRSSKRARGLKRTAVLVGLVVAAGGAWTALQGTRTTPAAEATHAMAEEARPVAVAVVSQIDSATPVEVTGTVQASLAADLSAKIMSRVTQVLVREGDRVQAGQVVVRLDAADLTAAVRQAEAAVRSATEAVKQARTEADIQAVQSSTRVAQAKAGLEAARQQLSMAMEGPRKQQKLQADSGVAEAEGALAQAKANLSLVREGARRQQRLQAQQSVLQAEAQYRAAKATYERYRSLFEQDVIPRQRYDEVKAQFDTAAAQYEIAKQQASLVDEGARPQEVLAAEEAVRQAEARLQAAKQQRELAHEGGRQQEIAAARAQVRQAEEALRMAQAATAETTIKQDHISLLAAQQQQAEAALQAARVQAAYAEIRAPFSGVVTGRRVDPGAMAAPGTPLVRIESADGHRLEATVPEARIRLIHLGQAIRVGIDSLRWEGTGRVTEIVPSADPGTRTFTVKIALPAVPRITSGVFGKAWLPGDERTRLVAPATAVVRRGQLESVLVMVDGTARLRMVRTGEESGGQVELLSGVQAGDRVIVSNPAGIPDGSPVRER
ncbi:MAG TPA: efflux RND transporter periplasmic adaptor subunit [Armatimonadetes bacterium]|jgi:HlyD family secretion protein|nr:efflux RND transporter periplasmic adaptor subunit [Armatimonadota bacterium]